MRAIAVKEMLQVWRDPISLMIALLMPFMQMMLLGYGVSLDVKHLPVCAFDREVSQQSRSLIDRFRASQYFRLAATPASYREVTQALDRGTCRLALVIPPDFTERLSDMRQSSVQVLIDATDTNTANIALGYAQAVISGYASDISAGTGGASAAASQLIAVESRVWFNEDLQSRNFIIPGVVALVMALVGAQLTSLTIAREWERGTMELLISTPVTPMELMLGKLAPYFAIGMLDAAFCLGVAVFWFGVPFRGEVLVLLATTALFLMVILGLGYMISSRIRSQVGAAQMGLLVTMMPTTLLSGYAFPIDQMPAAVQGVSYLVFARYYVTILKAVFLKGSGLIELAVPIVALVIYAAVVVFLATRGFRKRLD
ncbi:MAG TPA: ABC transporter permease [Dongiaceae bacterium]|nr:ABC transporter permease [Dongiaceae bacterium]